jgi:hypothetical protein
MFGFNSRGPRIDYKGAKLSLTCLVS